MHPRTPFELGDVASVPAVATPVAVVLPTLAVLGKRVLDVVGALVLLVVTAPVLVGLGVAVRLTSPGPVLFGHERIGRDGRRFRCWKFRTMVPDAQAQLAVLLQDPARRREFAENHKLKDDPRITRLGAFLRSSSLDELPQLLNVLLGHMSLVGPRPVVEDELPRYGSAMDHYLAVRPGVTGAWQVAGRSDESFAGRVALDVAYVDGLSVWADLRILLQTVKVVVLRIGAY